MKVLAIILAGGKGTRLYPLTTHRCKPAVPFGGKYRIIDFTLSNCINSGIRQINVMVQYLSDSLQKHIRDGWNILSPALGEYIDVYPPQQLTSNTWYQGTADAIFQNLYSIERVNPDFVLVLAGDHIYKMDYRQLIRYHIAKNADLTIATIPTPIEEAQHFGIMQVNNEYKIIGFEEKPLNPIPLPNNKKMCLASMGIYIFSKEVLIHYLKLDASTSSSHDFGKDIIPLMVKNNNVYSFSHQDNSGNPLYWKDVGTLQSYYNANMELLKKESEFDLFSENWKFRTFQAQSTPDHLKIHSEKDFFINNLITGGSVIQGSIKNSILSPGVIIEEDVQIEDSILLNSCHIKRGTRLKKVIIEKNVVISENIKIGYQLDQDKKHFFVTPEHITVIPKGSII